MYLWPSPTFGLPLSLSLWTTSSCELSCGGWDRRVIYILSSSTVSSQSQCGAGKSSVTESWAGISALSHLQDNSRNKELLRAQTSLLGQGWNPVESDPMSPSLPLGVTACLQATPRRNYIRLCLLNLLHLEEAHWKRTLLQQLGQRLPRVNFETAGGWGGSWAQAMGDGDPTNSNLSPAATGITRQQGHLGGEEFSWAMWRGREE